MSLDPYVDQMRLFQWAGTRLMLPPLDAKIAGLWKRKWDTNQIAAALRMQESTVANRLAKLRDTEAV